MSTFSAFARNSCQKKEGRGPIFFPIHLEWLRVSDLMSPFHFTTIQRGGLSAGFRIECSSIYLYIHIYKYTYTKVHLVCLGTYLRESLGRLKGKGVRKIEHSSRRKF